MKEKTLILEKGRYVSWSLIEGNACWRGEKARNKMYDDMRKSSERQSRRLVICFNSFTNLINGIRIQWSVFLSPAFRINPLQCFFNVQIWNCELFCKCEFALQLILPSPIFFSFVYLLSIRWIDSVSHWSAHWSEAPYALPIWKWQCSTYQTSSRYTFIRLLLCLSIT